MRPDGVAYVKLGGLSLELGFFDLFNDLVHIVFLLILRMFLMLPFEQQRTISFFHNMRYNITFAKGAQAIF